MPNRTKILLVEVAGPARDALAALLGDEGFEVVLSAGSDAVELARQHEPAVALVDLVSCQGTIIGQLDQLRRSLQVIAITEYGRIAPALAALRAGALDYLIKPIRGDELLVVLAKAIEHHQLSRELERLRGELERRAT